MPGTAVINPSHTPGSMSNLQKHGHWMRKHAQSMCLGGTSSQDPKKSQRTLSPPWDLLPAWNASPSLLRAHSWHCAPCPSRSRRAGCGSGSSRMQARGSLTPFPCATSLGGSGWDATSLGGSGFPLGSVPVFRSLFSEREPSQFSAEHGPDSGRIPPSYSKKNHQRKPFQIWLYKHGV